MKKRNAKFALTLVCVLLLSSLSCFAAAEDGPVTLRFMWWGSDARHEATLKVIDDYMALHPDVKIEAEYGTDDGYYQKLTTQLASGTEPDIVQIVAEWFAPLAGDGSTFAELDNGQIDTDGFDQAYISSVCTVDGHLRALPTGIGGQIMAVNTSFFEQYGIPLDTKWNWDNLMEWGRKIHEQNSEAYLLGGFYGDDSTPVGIVLKFHVLQQLGIGPWVSDDYELGFTVETLANTYRYFLELIDEGVFQPLDETIVAMTPLENMRWVEGNVGMMHAMTSTISSFEVEEFNVDVANCPVAEDAKDSGFGVTPTQLLTVSANCKHPEAARDFLNYFYNDPQAIQTLKEVRGSQPTSGGAAVLAEAGLVSERNAKAMDICRATASKYTTMVGFLTEFNVPYCDITNEVLFGEITPEEGAQRLVDEYTEIIAQFKAKQ